MTRLTELAHDILREVLRPGDSAIDATAGNGHDTLFLAEAVGQHGHVFAFDVDIVSGVKIRWRLAPRELQNTTFFNVCHSNLLLHLPEDHHDRVAVVMFNLGFRPGSDHTTVTQTSTTLAGLNSSWLILKPGGVLSVMAYPGHFGGAEEAAAVDEWMIARGATRYDSVSATGPRLYILRR